MRRVRALWAWGCEEERREEGPDADRLGSGGLLWRVNVGLYLLWWVSVAGDAVAPMKVWSDAHTPKKRNRRGGSPPSVKDKPPSRHFDRPRSNLEPRTVATIQLTLRPTAPFRGFAGRLHPAPSTR